MLPDYLTVSRCARSRVDFVPDLSRHPALSAPAHQSPSPTRHAVHPVPSSPRRSYTQTVLTCFVGSCFGYAGICFFCVCVSCVCLRLSCAKLASPFSRLSRGHTGAPPPGNDLFSVSMPAAPVSHDFGGGFGAADDVVMAVGVGVGVGVVGVFVVWVWWVC